jgi:UTP pyrophosphatase
MKYLSAYSETIQTQVHALIANNQLGAVLLKKYSSTHTIRNDKALFDYVMSLKNEFLRGADPLSKVAFDSKLKVIQHALGTHTTVSRVQGNKLKSKREIRVASRTSKSVSMTKRFTSFAPTWSRNITSMSWI